MLSEWLLNNRIIRAVFFFFEFLIPKLNQKEKQNNKSLEVLSCLFKEHTWILHRQKVKFSWIVCDNRCRVRLFVTPWTVAHQAPLSMRFSRQEYQVGCHSLLQRLFPTQGLNLSLLHCRWILYCLSHQGSLSWVIFTLRIRFCPASKTVFSWCIVFLFLSLNLFCYWKIDTYTK